jgi:EAL domain-containing protein (putative c-di-GMP-specific phosphodiesterase class I)/CheY-like chemotaxis protein
MSREPDAAQTVPGATEAAEEAPYRVLVVEDDASQALFAEGVMRSAGIQARAVRTAAEVMPAMEEFRPELVLMDLHLPGMSGTELTMSIRAHADFAHIPVVFLTGDQDPERQFEALEQGADDFLSKPIRPRHLMAAVLSRIKRARAMQRQRPDDAVRDAESGLHYRPYLLRGIAAALAADDDGGALFVEIQNTMALRERYGYAGFEHLMHEVGRRCAQVAGVYPAARINDSAFLVYAAGCEGTQLEALARTLRDGIGAPPIEYDGMPQRLRAVIGYSLLGLFSDAGRLLDAIEQAARTARSASIGLAEYIPAAIASEPADALVAAMRAGLAEDKAGNNFELIFQPIVSVAGGNDAQFQTLLRLRDAEGTLHRAASLIPAAEAAGLMPDIDRWVLRDAIELLHRRQDEGRQVRLFVSQSPRTLAEDAHAQWLLECIASNAIDGASLVIDLRLDDALVHGVTLRQFGESLIPAGVRLCLSQFSQSPEAEALLQQIPLGFLRLSPRYSNAHSYPELRDELRGVIERAHRLGLQVIGPQVEDPQSAATLWMSGIDFIQGNLVQQAEVNLEFDFTHAVL